MLNYYTPVLRTEKIALNALYAQSGVFTSSFSQCSIGDTEGAGCDSPNPDLVFAICTSDDVDAETANSSLLTIKSSNVECESFSFELSDCQVFENPPEGICPSGEIFILCHVPSLEDVLCSDDTSDCGVLVYGFTLNDEFFPCEQTSK